jgi:HAD superfamily hydrolase (TIGR01509 family)
MVSGKGLQLKKAVIFDMDGVILDSEPIHKKILMNLFRKMDLQINDCDYEEFLGLGLHKMWNLISLRFDLNQTIEELVIISNREIYDCFLKIRNLEPQTGLTDFIFFCKRKNQKIAVASSTARKTILLILEKLHMLHFFDLIVSGEEVEKGKPAPDVFLETARKLNLPSSACLVIEDSEHGVSAAKAAGMACIGYFNPSCGKMDLQKADLIVSGFPEILELLSA